MRRTVGRDRERGVAAVEFALIVPLLMAIIIGIVEFSLAWNYKTQMNNAAQAAARDYAVSRYKVATDATAVTQAKNVFTGAMSGGSGFTYSFRMINPTTGAVYTGECPVTETSPSPSVRVRVTANRPTVTRMFGTSFSTVGTGVAKCS